MFKNINFGKFPLFFVYGIFLILSINTSPTNAQEKFLLAESEMPGYELVRKSNIIWIIGEKDQGHNAIGQKWHIAGNNYYISYCEFETEAKAIHGTAYAAVKSNAIPFFGGSLTGSIVGDGSWTLVGNKALYFVRGNVGIKIDVPINFKENDRQALVSISSKLLNKIESNLSPEVLSIEEKAKQKQISMKEYHTITDPVVNSTTMNGFSLHTTWNSKWLIEPDKVIVGIRKEWKNEQGSIIGIDIGKFDSDSLALKASEIQNRNTHVYSHNLTLDNLDLLKSILTEWKKKWSDFQKNQFSVIGVKRNIAVHVYLFDATGIDTNLIYSIVEKLAEQI